MPRTKTSRSKRTLQRHAVKAPSADVLNVVQDIKKQWLKGKNSLELRSQATITSVRNAFCIAAMGFPESENFPLYLGAYDDDEVDGSRFADWSVDEAGSTVSVSLDGDSTASSFMTQSELSVPLRSRSRGRVPRTPAPLPFTRNLRSSSEGRDKLLMKPPSTLRNRFCTPATNTVPDGSRYNQITPKVVPNASMSVLRRPRGGEMAFAMTGSPLLVSSSNDGDEICNVNLPLGDGRVLSILPSAIRPRDLPEVSDDTMEQLVQLRNNLNTIIDTAML